jgi:putative FmdB family regulatory protein
MPLYEYRCHRCGKTFEVIQKFSDAPVSVHENCGGEVERLLSAPALQFKGTGWYVTDYGRNGGSAGRKSESKSETASDTKSDSKKPAAAESKSESKAPAKG